jgi:hypothetical protein
VYLRLDGPGPAVSRLSSPGDPLEAEDDSDYVNDDSDDCDHDYSKDDDSENRDAGSSSCV